MILYTPPARVLSQGLVCDRLHKVVSLLRHLNKRLLVCQVRGSFSLLLDQNRRLVKLKMKSNHQQVLSDTSCPVESPLCGGRGADKLQLTHWMVVHCVSGPVGLVAPAVQRSRRLWRDSLDDIIRPGAHAAQRTNTQRDPGDQTPPTPLLLLLSTQHNAKLDLQGDQ